MTSTDRPDDDLVRNGAWLRWMVESQGAAPAITDLEDDGDQRILVEGSSPECGVNSVAPVEFGQQGGLLHLAAGATTALGT